MHTGLPPSATTYEGAIITPDAALFDEGRIATSASSASRTRTSPPAARRHEAYLAFCKKHNLSAVASLPGLGMKQGYEQAASVLTPQTTALVCATDTWRWVPANICRSSASIICRWRASAARAVMKFLHPEIITVDPGYAESGRQAAAQLIEQINGRSEPRQIVIPRSPFVTLLNRLL